jgi:hypothetical protein
MGLLPLFLLALLSLPRLAAIGGLFVMLPLLGLAHKAGLVAAVMIPVCFALSPIVGRLRTKWTPVILLIPSLAVSLLIGGTGISSLLFRPLSRLALLIPLSFAGWIGAALLPRVVRSTDSGWMERHSSRAMLVGGLATLPLVFANDMYGTLLALPFIAFSGTVGLQWIVACTPTARVPFLLAATAVLTFGPALMIPTAPTVSKPRAAPVPRCRPTCPVARDSASPGRITPAFALIHRRLAPVIGAAISTTGSTISGEFWT